MLQGKKKCEHPAGTSVEAKASGWKKFYKGKVTAFDEKLGTYTVEFEDGDVQSGVRSFNIRAKKTFTAPDGKTFTSKAEYREYVLKQFCFENRIGETLVKLPGDINGQSFNIKNLKNCQVQLLDFSEQVLIDKVENCKLLIGPSCGSVFVREAKNCEIFIACKQFRSRDCDTCTISLYTKTEPIVETSTKMRFYPYKAQYPGQTEQFSKASLVPDVNHWCNVFDFNKDDPAIEEPHWELVNKEEGWPEWTISLSDEKFKGMAPENPVPEDAKAEASVKEIGFAFGVGVTMGDAKKEMAKVKQEISANKEITPQDLPEETKPESEAPDAAHVERNTGKSILIFGESNQAKTVALSLFDTASTIYVSERVKLELEAQEQKPEQWKPNLLVSLKKNPPVSSLSMLVICGGDKETDLIWSSKGKENFVSALETLEEFLPILIKQKIESKVVILGKELELLKQRVENDLRATCSHVTVATI